MSLSLSFSFSLCILYLLLSHLIPCIGQAIDRVLINMIQTKCVHSEYVLVHLPLIFTFSTDWHVDIGKI